MSSIYIWIKAIDISSVKVQFSCFAIGQKHITCRSTKLHVYCLLAGKHWSHGRLDRATILSKWSRKTSIIVVTGSKFMQQRTTWTTIAKHEFMHDSCFAIVLHIVLCCINLLPVTTMMLVLASFLMLRRAHCCSIQSTMRSVPVNNKTFVYPWIIKQAVCACAN